MTWFEFAIKYDKTLKQEDVEGLLMNETAFPFAGVRYTVKQLLSAIRRRKNKIIGCEMCGQKLGFCNCGEVMMGAQA